MGDFSAKTMTFTFFPTLQEEETCQGLPKHPGCVQRNLSIDERQRRRQLQLSPGSLKAGFEMRVAYVDLVSLSWSMTSLMSRMLPWMVH